MNTIKIILLIITDYNAGWVEARNPTYQNKRFASVLSLGVLRPDEASGLKPAISPVVILNMSRKKLFLPPMLNFFSDGLNLKQTAGLVNRVEGVFTWRIFPILKLQKFRSYAVA
jgi:hypothetical protein